MAALQYKAKHNKVGYLLKPTESDDNHNIIDFLRSSHIRYALTANPIIFDSLVKQFWSTVTLKAPEIGPPAILATIDRTPYVITEDLVRSHLQLANDGGVTNLPILKIYSGMDALGYVTEGNAKKFLMYPRFLQTILRIETRVNRQYKDVPHHVQAPDQSPPHLTTPSRPQSPDHVAPILEHNHSSTQPATAVGSFPSTEDAPLGGEFNTSSLMSSHTPPADQPLGGVEDPITLTALSFVVSTLVQKVHSLKAELHDHKKLFKDVVGKLVKKVKSLEVKQKIKKTKMVVSVSDEEDNTTPNVDLDALCALANAAMAIDSDVPPGIAASNTGVAPGDTGVVVGDTGVVVGDTGVAPGDTGVAPVASGVALGDSNVSLGFSVAPTTTLAVPVDSTNIPTAVPADRLNVPARASNKGKSLMIEEYIPIPVRTFRQMEEDRLGEEAAKRLHEEEMAKLERERTLLGDDVSEDNFPARMAALIKKKRQALAEQLFKERENRPLTPAQQKAYMRQYVKNQSNAIYNTVASPPSSRTRRKSLGRKHMHKPKSTLPTLDLDAPAQAFLKVIVDDDSDDEDSVDEVWSAVVGWEILSTPLDRQDLIKLYGLVVQYYDHHTATSARLLFWGDLQVLFDSQAGGKDVSYSLSIKLMKKMLLHKLEIDSDFVGNDLTTAEQL
nr:xylulose kinase-1 [Tanacetum cinerariifolium]